MKPPCCSEDEAGVMRANSWLYHYYMVQSRLQIGLAYGAASPGLAAYYHPHVTAQPGYYEHPVGVAPHGAALSPASYLGHAHAAAATHAAAGFAGYPSYHALYSPAAAAPHYHAHLAATQGAEHASHAHAAHHLAAAAGGPSGAGAGRDTKEHSAPLDFSKDYSGSRSAAAAGAEYTGPGSQQSSPSLRSDTSSSPVYHPPHESLYGAPEVAVLTQARHSSIR